MHTRAFGPRPTRLLSHCVLCPHLSLRIRVTGSLRLRHRCPQFWRVLGNGLLNIQESMARLTPLTSNALQYDRQCVTCGRLTEISRIRLLATKSECSSIMCISSSLPKQHTDVIRRFLSADVTYLQSFVDKCPK